MTTREEQLSPKRVRNPNREVNGELFLLRCYHCESEHGRENWAPAVAAGTCAWCGWPNAEPKPREELDTYGY